jgi:hydrophobic/amphiphilic exporter-1 (mainly G- bacteria), HAE1 family
MSSLSDPFIRRPAMTALLTLTVILFGVLAFRSLPVNDLPAVDYPVITVEANYPGASPTTMANNIATPLERQFMQIPGLELVTSQSAQGRTSFTLQFALTKTLDGAATDVQTAISQASGNLPTDLPSPPTLSKNNPNDQAILYIALTSNSVTAGRLYEYGNTQVAQRISILPGVSRVLIYGTKSAIRVKADPDKLSARGMSMDDLNKAIAAGTSYQAAGQFDGNTRTFLLRPQGQLESAEQYADLIVSLKDGAPVYLRDVAEIEDSVVDERLQMRFWARGYPAPSATAVIAVFRQAGSNAVEVASSVRQTLPEIGLTLPKAVNMTPIYDRSLSIVRSVADVEETLVIAFILVIAVIFVFLGRAADTLIPVVALPMSLLMTFVVMQILGYSVNNLTLMALTLAIGFLVDDAIVFLENTVRRMERGEAVLQATFASAKEINFTILSMTLSLAAVFLPLAFMPGLIGRIFREFSITIIVSILASGIVSLTLTPLMCSRMLSGDRGHHGKKTAMERFSNWFLNPIINFYSRTLHWFLKHVWVSVIIWIGSFVAMVVLALLLPRAFLPVGDSSFILGVLIGPEGSSPSKMHSYQYAADKALQDNDATRITFTMMGNSGFLPANQGLLLAFLKDPKERPPIGAVAGQMMGDLNSQVLGTFSFLRPVPVLEISTGATANLQGEFAYSVSGIDPKETYETGQKLLAKMYEYPGFASVSSDYFNNTPNLEINILRDKASSYGISSSRIESVLRQAYSQNYVYLIKKADDQYQVILETKDNSRSKPEDLAQLYILSDDGQRSVPLTAVATWHETVGPQTVNHINQFTSVTIFFNLKPGVAIGEATDFVLKAAAEIVPPTVRGEMRGQAQDFQNTMWQLVVLAILAVFVMYVILGILYESYVHPLTVLSSLPVALVGGFFTLWIFNAQLSLYAGIGAFMLMGIVKKNGIMIIDFALQRQAAGASSVEAIHEASIDRFRPIMMTTLAALMGAVPIALGWGADGESRQPLGLIIVGGLIVSQLITLYVTPALYLIADWVQVHVLNHIPLFRAHPLQTPEQDTVAGPAAS